MFPINLSNSVVGGLLELFLLTIYAETYEQL